MDPTYATPKANLELPPEASPEIPEDVLKRIKHGWVAGLVSIAITTLFTVLALAGANPLGLDAWAFVDVVIMLGLVYGMYRKSRVCAVLIFLFFALNKIIMWTESGSVSGLPLAVVFFWYYGQAIRGTFAYHRIVGDAAARGG
jgi:serine/threonine-protein kinase